MYTSYIGKKFLDIFKKRKSLSVDYTAQQFFEEEFFPLFFDNEQHLMHVGNSPFFQKPTQEAINESGSRSKAQLKNLQTKIAEGQPSGAIYVGFAAEDSLATSSGQLTSIDFGTSSEDMYASWIGQALAIGVSGGFVLLIDKEPILWALFEGWTQYRKYLSQTPNLKDKQIETWNGHWLCHALSKDYHETVPTAGFNFKTQDVMGKLAIPTQDWVQVIFALSRKYPDESVMAYAYSLSQTNTTLGFINLFLPQVKNLLQLKEKLYPEQEGISLKSIEALYETFYNFKNACKFGAIGLRALEPDKLRQFMPGGAVPFASGKDLKLKTEDEYFQYQIYKTWIIAMLSSKTELDALAAQVAQALIAFESKEARTNVNKQLTTETMSVRTQREFIENLIKVMAKDESTALVFKQVKDSVIQLPTDLFPLFLTLIRFEYQFQKSIKS
jgi:hypothetical protein